MGFQWIPTIPTWMFMALVDSDIYHLLSELRYIYILYIKCSQLYKHIYRNHNHRCPFPVGRFIKDEPPLKKPEANR